MLSATTARSSSSARYTDHGRGADDLAGQPQFGEDQQKTDRDIPVVELQRTGH